MKTIVTLFFLYTSTMLFAQVADTPGNVCPLLVGETIPDVKLKTVGGKEIGTHQVLRNQRSIVLVYRGGWCPFCNTHLNEISKIESDLKALGFSIVAIGTDSPEEMAKNADKNKLTYVLLSDSDGTFAKACGIAFRAPGYYEQTLTKSSNGANKEFILPVPALFITDEAGKILFEYLNPDYKTRISSDLLLAAARALSKKK